MKLMLLYKEISNNGEYYIFDTPKGKKKANYNTAIQVIRNTNPKDRNCKITNGRIGLKQGFGNLKSVIVENDRTPKETKKRILRLYTKPKYYNQLFIEIHDNFFIKTLQDKQFILSQADLLKEIDNARIINDNDMTIKTPYGACNIRRLSTGIKVLLNTKWILKNGVDKELLINGDECGDNILEKLFSLVADTNISIYLSRETELEPQTKYMVYLNGRLMPEDADINDFIPFMSYQNEEVNIDDV